MVRLTSSGGTSSSTALTRYGAVSASSDSSPKAIGSSGWSRPRAAVLDRSQWRGVVGNAYRPGGLLLFGSGSGSGSGAASVRAVAGAPWRRRRGKHRIGQLANVLDQPLTLLQSTRVSLTTCSDILRPRAGLLGSLSAWRRLASASAREREVSALAVVVRTLKDARRLHSDFVQGLLHRPRRESFRPARSATSRADARSRTRRPQRARSHAPRAENSPLAAARRRTRRGERGARRVAYVRVGHAWQYAGRSGRLVDLSQRFHPKLRPLPADL